MTIRAISRVRIGSRLRLYTALLNAPIALPSSGDFSTQPDRSSSANGPIRLMGRWYAAGRSRHRDSLRHDRGQLRSICVPIPLHDSVVGDASHGGFDLPAIWAAVESR